MSTNSIEQSQNTILPDDTVVDTAFYGLRRNALFAGMLLISLFDFYFQAVGVPIVPIVGTVLFVTASLTWPHRFDGKTQAQRLNTILFVLVLVVFYIVSALWGVAAFGSGSIKAALGMGIGTVVLAVTLLQESNDDYRRTVLTLCSRLLAFHISFWILQFLIYITTHNFVDLIQPVTGVATRHVISVEGVDVPLDRCSGLFAEPAIYVMTMYFLITVRLIYSGLKLRILDVIAIATIVGSVSLTGILLMVVVCFLALLSSIRTWRAVIALVIVAAACITIAVAASDSEIGNLISTRLAAPTSDPSGRVRTVDAITSFENLPESAQIFGIGVGNTEMVEYVASGFFDLLVSFGVVGIFLVAVLFVAFMKSRRLPWFAWLFIVIMLPFGTFITIQCWWLWFGMMALASQQRREEMETQA